VDEKVEVPFHWMGSPKSPDGERATPFSHEHKRRQLLERLNQLPSVQISAERIRARPTFDLSVLNDEAAANRLSQIFDWYAATVDATEGTFPEEAIAPAVQRMEGATKKITVNRYERSAAARDACIRYHGASCAVCGMEFGEEYGALGEGFIHVHHIEPLSQQEALRRSDPQVDLRPVCPNCHAMIHHGEDAPHSIEKLRRVRANTSTER
jgi:5-methylcytosine-specific restriction protein A